MADLTDPDIAAAVARVRDDSDASDFMSCTYSGKHKIVLGHVGTGGLESLKGKLKDHEVHYGLVRLPYGDTGSHKFVHVCWTGSDVPVMARARVSTHKGSVEEAMGHTSVNIHTDTLNDLEENTIYGKLHKAAGVHYDSSHLTPTPKSSSTHARVDDLAEEPTYEPAATATTATAAVSAVAAADPEPVVAAVATSSSSSPPPPVDGPEGGSTSSAAGGESDEELEEQLAQYREYTERLVRQTMRDFEIEGDLLEDGEREAFVAALERVAAAGNAPASSTFQADLEEELVNLDTHMARLRVVAPAIRQRDLTDKRICVLLTFEANETESRRLIKDFRAAVEARGTGTRDLTFFYSGKFDPRTVAYSKTLTGRAGLRDTEIPHIVIYSHIMDVTYVLAADNFDSEAIANWLADFDNHRLEPHNASEAREVAAHDDESAVIRVTGGNFQTTIIDPVAPALLLAYRGRRPAAFTAIAPVVARIPGLIVGAADVAHNRIPGLPRTRTGMYPMIRFYTADSNDDHVDFRGELTAANVFAFAVEHCGAAIDGSPGTRAELEAAAVAVEADFKLLADARAEVELVAYELAMLDDTDGSSAAAIAGDERETMAFQGRDLARLLDSPESTMDEIRAALADLRACAAPLRAAANALGPLDGTSEWFLSRMPCVVLLSNDASAADAGQAKTAVGVAAAAAVEAGSEVSWFYGGPAFVGTSYDAARGIAAKFQIGDSPAPALVIFQSDGDNYLFTGSLDNTAAVLAWVDGFAAGTLQPFRQSALPTPTGRLVKFPSLAHIVASEFERVTNASTDVLLYIYSPVRGVEVDTAVAEVGTLLEDRGVEVATMSYDDNDIDTHVLPDLRAPRGSIFPYVCLVRKDSHKVERFVGSVTPARLITFVHEYMEGTPFDLEGALGELSHDSADVVVDNMSATMFRGLIRAYGKFKSVLSAKRDLEDRLAHFEDEEAVVGLDISTAGEVAAAAAANDSEGDAPGEAGVTPGRYIPSEHLFDDMEDVSGMGVADIFKVFLAANELAHALHYMDAIREQLGGLYGPAFFQALKDNVTHFKSKRIFAALDKRMAKEEYEGQPCTGMRALCVGAGPAGLRSTLEAIFLGAEVDILEKRKRFSRHNVLHLWQFAYEDIKDLGGRLVYPKFCTGGINHCGIRQLQLLLTKLCLIAGATFFSGVKYESMADPDADVDGFHPVLAQADHAVCTRSYNILIGAQGVNNTIPGFERKTVGGLKRAIGVTCNFVNHGTREELDVPELPGLALHFNQKLFRDLEELHDIKLENIVFFRSPETHYFVTCVAKESLLKKKALKEDRPDENLLDRDNINWPAMHEMCREYSGFLSGMPPHVLREFAVDGQGQPSCAVFDFTSLFRTTFAARVRERGGKRLLVNLVGDSLMLPFWPKGTGAAIAFLSSMDGAWMMRSFGMGMEPLALLSERDDLYKILANVDPHNIDQDWTGYTIDPKTRYPAIIERGTDVSEYYDVE